MEVIAILDWELSTIGHPLMDVVFFTSPFLDDYIKIDSPSTSSPEKYSSPYRAENRASSGMPDPEELLDRYAAKVGFDLRKDGGGRDWQTGAIFQFVRSATISHGIQARTISGQASSTFSHLYFSKTKTSMDAALVRVNKAKEAAAHGISHRI
ncbi:hypothetical protein Sste5346_004201 [Sporothrix stenoceras]|uniref:Aminoglycoside phosphotransferase domain-containing protein n=1 Tax=Sporothrix stenoceras TaxID=5173 RepID=A0ABR3ZCB1_9PEZI